MSHDLESKQTLIKIANKTDQFYAEEKLGMRDRPIVK